MRDFCIEKFRKNLLSVKSEKDDFINVIAKIPAYSNGVQYLYDNILIPSMKGKKVKSSKIDFKSFTHDDIQEIYDFYELNYTSSSRDFSRLLNLAESCIGSIPKAIKVSFI